MKLPSRLFKSRHGVYYYRFQFQHETRRKERRISLHTKSPTIAKAKAFQVADINLDLYLNDSFSSSNGQPEAEVEGF
ncbi:MAG: hypothetical protein ACYDCF_08035 [Burkholderiales bacterium]|nr:hypothetical protein [Ferrovum sp.]